MRKGALVEPLAVGLHAVRKAKLGVGARILIVGAGPIGLSVAAFACARGAREVVVSEMNATRREKSMAMGATAVIDPASENTAEAFAKDRGLSAGRDL